MNKIFSYEKYMAMMEEWVLLKTSSSNADKPSYSFFTKLNLQRSKRLDKTIQLSAELINVTNNLQDVYTWTVITESWCGDSAQSLPVIAAIAKQNPGKIKLQIVLRDENPKLMNNYLTNGTRSIPKLIAVNETKNKETFVWGPRPAAAQQLLINWKQNPQGRSWDDFEKELHSWYAVDKTQSIQAEFMNILLNENRYVTN